jgi:predicted ATP-dependent endonuclease of OLD family
MKLIAFSVGCYRSITNTHRIEVSGSLILIGKNNEGKSNILHALATAMRLIQDYSVFSKSGVSRTRRGRDIYDWDKDFPIQFQGKKPNGKSHFRVEFELTDAEIQEFRREIKSNLNGVLPIEVEIGKDNLPQFKVVKSGPGAASLSKKAEKVAKFIGGKIDITYIPAIRTSSAAISVVEEMLESELEKLEEEAEYQKALSKISELQAPILKAIAARITEPLKQFIPQIKGVTVEISQEERFRALRRSCEVVIDDGNPTSIKRKGDGVKSLAAISLMRGARDQDKASILALEEPESHLHPSAIHALVDVLEEIIEDHQVIITTHCPLFVDRVNLQRNVLVSDSKAKPATSVSEIRGVLGVRASDNLISARLVLVVEGEDDKIAITAIISEESELLLDALRDGVLVIDPANGSGNLGYKASMHKASVCMVHVLADNDRAGQEQIEKAERDGVIKPAESHFVICNGMAESEFEDCIKLNVYREAILAEFGVDLDIREFRSNKKKWSDRVRDCFLSKGKRFTDSTKQRCKMVVAKSIAESPSDCLIEQKSTSIRSLISDLEGRLAI